MTGHEKPACRINNLNELKQHMCTAAVRRSRIKPEVCQNCEMPCAYGIKALRIMNLELPEYNHDFDALGRIELLTLSQRIRGVRKEKALNRVFKI